ncbi:acyltransferase family protein [Ideonella oryzae]|uniref:Acyltransferase n=1 Tax=Ideonella oryzae TaxID=2937441 RepID=A0ABT1BRN3_9BURK|nr:acyltransferase [Ideonella oryzae]MCO5978888.1 acyltransferase [Ideonella oryzae]
MTMNLHVENAAPVERLVGIQYLRAVAAVLVVCYHSSQMVGMPKYLGEIPWSGFWKMGFIGVDLFFVVSGFVIVLVSVDAKWHYRVGWKDFFIKRFVRIIPMMWLATLMYAVAKGLGRGDVAIPQVLSSLILIPGNELAPNVLWTLRHELFFYLVVGAMIGFGIFPAYLSAVAMFLLAVMGSLGGVGADSPWYFIFAEMNALFAVGVGGFALWRHRSFKGDSHWGWAAALVVALLSLIYMAIWHLGYERSNVSHLFFMASSLLGLTWLSLGLSGVASLGPFRWLERVGDASYAIYLCHQLVISALLGVLAARFKWVGAEWGFALCVFLAVGFGIWVHTWLERPLIQRLRAWMTPVPMNQRTVK